MSRSPFQSCLADRPAGEFFYARALPHHRTVQRAGLAGSLRSRARSVEPGVSPTQLYALTEIREVYVIEGAGEGTVEVAGVTAPAGPGDRVDITGRRHRKTPSRYRRGGPDLSSACAHLRFVPEAYRTLDSD